MAASRVCRAHALSALAMVAVLIAACGQDVGAGSPDSQSLTVKGSPAGSQGP